MKRSMLTTPKTIPAILAGILFFALVQHFLSAGVHAGEYRIAPVTNHGKKWRVGYCQGGPYVNYPANLKAIAKGMYHAKIMAKIFNGAHPGELDQIFEDPKKIAINLKTAQAIGFKIPRGLMQVADEVYK
jgi:hypothetical protein